MSKLTDTLVETFREKLVNEYNDMANESTEYSLTECASFAIYHIFNVLRDEVLTVDLRNEYPELAAVFDSELEKVR